MLTRMRYREVPPRVDYELTERGRALMPILGELARWGYEWAWSTPRASECVDLGAIFRLAPGLLRGPGANGIRGSVELAVHAAHGQGEPNEGEPHPNQGEPHPNQGELHPNQGELHPNQGEPHEPHPDQGEPHVYTLTFSRGRAELRERPAEHADARVAGTTAAWVAAFSPAGARRSVLGLEISGDCQLATQVLEGLTMSAVHRSQDAIRAVALGTVGKLYAGLRD